MPSPRGRLFSHLANSDTICYNIPGASDMRWRCQYTVGGGPFFGRRPKLLSSSTTSEGGDGMVTYSDLFQFGILIVGIISLVIQVNNKKK